MNNLPSISFTKGWKYQTTDAVRFALPYDQFGSLPEINHPEVYACGGHEPLLLVYRDFLWDGPSGPTYDTDDSMTPSLFHDAMYYMCREGRLDYKVWRPTIDLHFLALNRLAGMAEVRALAWYEAVKNAAEAQAMPQAERIYTIK